MALGDGGNNFTSNSAANNNKKDNSPTVYCPISYKNPDASSDPSELSFSYWKNLLKITISPKVEPKPGDKFTTYDHVNNASIHLNAMKARIFKKEIEEMIINKTPNSVSVSSGATGLITFSNGKEYGVDAYMLVIRKLDENGTVNSSYSYQFNGDSYYNSIRNFDEVSLKYDRMYFPALEIEAFLDILEDFYKAQSYATAYTVVDSMKFDVSRVNTKIDIIMEKLGIPKYNSNNGGGKSFFDNSKDSSPVNLNNSQGASRTTTLDAIASELE